MFINIRPIPKAYPIRSIQSLASGCGLLRYFLVSVTITTIWQGFYLIQLLIGMGGQKFPLFIWWMNFLLVIMGEGVLFWNGMLRVYFKSRQLGIKHRVLGVLLGWIFGLNIYYLFKILHIASSEVEVEMERWELDSTRQENEICKTKYPLLMVHGVFFRDFRYFNYWGRVPMTLKKNGATIFYGEHDSAACVEDCGQDLARRIKEIVEAEGCEKVNIIAHSKGGLDSRVAISRYGAAPYVASLTTINTPHRGCIFAEYLLGKVPKKMREEVSKAYNTTLKRLGDKNPDFIAAVEDLTESKCLQRNTNTPDMPGILYESVMSYCNKAASGRFPLNVSYPLVSHFDGKNDGLVSITSASWGSNFLLLEPVGERGISHGDMIDFNRENFTGFDVREFYVTLVKHLKERGY